MCKEQPVILVNKVVDPKRLIGKKWRAEEEERHKGSLTQKKDSNAMYIHMYVKIFLALYTLAAIRTEDFHVLRRIDDHQGDTSFFFCLESLGND
jgi:hypothetical protein